MTYQGEVSLLVTGNVIWLTFYSPAERLRAPIRALRISRRMSPGRLRKPRSERFRRYVKGFGKGQEKVIPNTDRTAGELPAAHVGLLGAD